MSRRLRPWLVPLVVCLALLVVEELARAAREGAQARRLIESARHFRSQLDEPQRAKLCFGFDAPARLEWGFVPGDRKGLALGELDERRRVAAHELLAALLSTQGYLKVTGIVELENTLRELEHNPARDPGRYWLAYFGEPGVGAWSVRFEGHHVSLQVAGEGEAVLGLTPFFLGTNPATLRSGPRAGLRLLRREEEFARELYTGLEPALRARATLAGAVPADVVLGPGRAAPFEKLEGLPFAALPPAARALAERLLDEIVGDYALELAAPARARLSALAPEQLGFAWCGGTAEGEPHYWRISTPDAAFELDNVQGGANHVHRLWRERAGDFGGDALREHYAAEHRR